MSNDPINRFYGMRLSEWIEMIPDDLDVDAVGLWHIIPGLRRSFGMTDEAAIEDATRQVLARLLARGARPVIGGGGWHVVTEYGDTPQAIIDAVIAEWKRKGVDPDVEDVWFALPRFYEKRKPGG